MAAPRHCSGAGLDPRALLPLGPELCGFCPACPTPGFFGVALGLPTAAASGCLLTRRFLGAVPSARTAASDTHPRHFRSMDDSGLTDPDAEHH